MFFLFVPRRRIPSGNKRIPDRLRFYGDRTNKITNYTCTRTVQRDASTHKALENRDSTIIGKIATIHPSTNLCFIESSSF